MKAIRLFDDLFCRYLKYWHGFGDGHQDFFFRCRRCSGLVTWKVIQKGGCACSGSTPISPTNPKMTEWFRLLFLPWTVS